MKLEAAEDVRRFFRVILYRGLRLVESSVYNQLEALSHMAVALATPVQLREESVYLSGCIATALLYMTKFCE